MLPRSLCIMPKLAVAFHVHVQLSDSNNCDGISPPLTKQDVHARPHCTLTYVCMHAYSESQSLPIETAQDGKQQCLQAGHETHIWTAKLAVHLLETCCSS